MAAAITIELFSASTCNRCSEAKKRIQILIDELGDDRVEYRELDVLEELDYAVTMGILTTPSIVINGQLVFVGMPSLKQFNSELKSRLTSL